MYIFDLRIVVQWYENTKEQPSHNNYTFCCFCSEEKEAICFRTSALHLHTHYVGTEHINREKREKMIYIYIHLKQIFANEEKLSFHLLAKHASNCVCLCQQNCKLCFNLNPIIRITHMNTLHNWATDEFFHLLNALRDSIALWALWRHQAMMHLKPGVLWMRPAHTCV